MSRFGSRGIRVVVIGVGNFGHAFVRRLAGQDGVEILALDMDPDVVDEVGSIVSRAVVADSTDRDVLEDLDVGTADYAVISLGHVMDVSILTTLHVRSLGVKNIYVKALSADHGRILGLIGATRIIHPERQAAESLAEAIGRPNVLEFISLGEGYSIVEFEPSSKLTGKSLEELDLRNRFGVTVIGVKEYLTGQRQMNPAPDYVVEDDVSLLILGTIEQVERLQEEGGRG